MRRRRSEKISNLRYSRSLASIRGSNFHAPFRVFYGYPFRKGIRLAHRERGETPLLRFNSNEWQKAANRYHRSWFVAFPIRWKLSTHRFVLWVYFVGQTNRCQAGAFFKDRMITWQDNSFRMFEFENNSVVNRSIAPQEVGKDFQPTSIRVHLRFKLPRTVSCF